MFRNLRQPRTVAVAAMLVLICSVAALAQSRWIRAAPFPEPDEELYGVSTNGKLYIIGGYGAGKGRGINYEYDPASDSWTLKRPMARPAHHQAMAEYQGKIYVFGGFVAPITGGGWEPIDNAWEYDPAADLWRPLAPLPSKRGSAVAVQVDGKVYVIGGATTADGSTRAAISNNTTVKNLTTTDVYDISTNTWTSGAPMALGRNHAFAGTVGGKIYVIGGRIAHAFAGASQPTDVVEEYDPATNSWGAQRAKMPTARSGGGWGTYDGKIYVAGGEIATTSLVGAFRAVEAFDPATNSWTIMPSMPMPRHGVAGATIGNRFHLVSGMITSAAGGWGQDPDIEIHTASHDIFELPMSGTN